MLNYESPASGEKGCSVAAIILAAGAGRRMGAPKPMLDFRGRPMIGWVLDALAAVRAAPPLVAVQPDDTALIAYLGTRGATAVPVANWSFGMSASLRAALAAVDAAADACLIALADMPLVPAPIYAALVAAATPDRVVVPEYQGRWGHPRVWGRHYFAALRMVDGDAGGRALLRDRPEAVRVLPCVDPAICIDIDTPDDHKRYR